MNYTQTLEFLFQSLPAFRNQRRNGLQAGIGAHHRILPPHRQPPAQFLHDPRGGHERQRFRIAYHRLGIAAGRLPHGAFHLAPPAGFPRTHPRRRRDDSQTEGRELRGQTPRQDGRAGTVVLRNDRGTGFRLLRTERRRGRGDRNGTRRGDWTPRISSYRS